MEQPNMAEGGHERKMKLQANRNVLTEDEIATRWEHPAWHGQRRWL
jgi:hypothetical protein